MRVTFLGGADEVGASSLLIEISGKRLLIDAGIRPSPKARWGLHGDQLPHLDAINSPDVILVTHAHTDHTGALELVVGRYPHCPVFATPPTIALTRVLHADARRIMQARLDEEGELPLYDDIAVEKLLAALTPIEFHARLPLGENLAATFYPAGHIAGAALILLDSDEGRVLISGDISLSPQRTVDGCKPPTLRPDVLILESTYGGRLHANRATEERKLVERIAAIANAGGKVLIPAFALGRAQELIEILRAFRKAGELPTIPVWVDGMVRAVCGIYSQFPDALPLALQERNAKFFDETTRAIETVAQRNVIVWENNPGIIIASSGMLAGGPSLSYARALAGKPEHAILLTGYQDEESPGRKLQALATRGRGTLKLGKDVVDVQCQLGTYALSAHADEGQLIALTETLDPTTVFIVHGDAEARASLRKALRERGRRVELPRAGQTFDFRLRGVRPDRSSKPVRSDDPNRPLDLGLLWREIAGPGGHYFTLTELARAWWDDETRVDELRAALEKDDTHFVIAERDLVRARTHEQIEHKDLPGLGDLEGLSPPAMEPNQALTFAREQFPPEARLRRVGYRLDTHTLTLTFDFPDAVRERFAEIFARIQNATQWKIELDPEANQGALAMLARETLRDGEILKGPSIFREEKRVAVTGRGNGDVATMCEQFRATSGYTLSVTFADASTANNLVAAPTTGALEINAALGLIRAQLAGSTLYRTSLKSNEIVLSFISPHVGARYREKMDELTRTTGWALAINPQPNQNAIIQVAQELIARAGWVATRAPSIHVDRGEVRVSIAPKDFQDPSGWQAEFESHTGYRLIIESDAAQPAPTPNAPREDSVEIPVARIRLTRYQQTLQLDPAKQRKALEQLQRLGRVNKPIRVRRGATDYILLDGLYRLRAAQTLGWKRITAVVEERE